MKVALCLSGQPRSYAKGMEYHKKNLIDHYNVDVFMHTWPDIDEKIIDDLMDCYESAMPRELVMHRDDLIPDVYRQVEETYTRIPDPAFPAINTFKMWYSITRSIQMALSFSDYDVIVRSRYDYALNIQPPLEETMVSKIYVPADRMTKEHDFCADMFAWGTPRVMQIYADTYNNIPWMYARGVTFIGEDLLAENLKIAGLTGRNMVYVDMNNPFPPGPYNGNWHSMIRDDFTQWNNLRG